MNGADQFRGATGGSAQMIQSGSELKLVSGNLCEFLPFDKIDKNF
jgi:hypothetical protein